MKKKIAIVIEHGFHEMKKFVHSGFALELSKEFDIVWFVLKKGNFDFDICFKSLDFPIINFENEFFHKKYSVLKHLNQIVRKSWMLSNDIGLFHNYKSIKKRSFLHELMGNCFFKYLFEQIALTRSSFNSMVAQQLEENEIDLVLINGYNSFFSSAVIATAERLSIDIFYQVNSWKDLYVNNFIPSKSLTAIFVWNREMASDYLFHMPYLHKNTLIVSGNTSFDKIKVHVPCKSRTYYSKKYALDESSEWYYYTMMPPGVINNEIETIQFIAEKFYMAFGKTKQILIRRNPNHDKNSFLNIDFPENTKLTDHFCEFNQKEDILLQSPEGEEEWMDLLFYCCSNISIPSTVTLEFLLLNKVVLNVEFDSKNCIDSRLSQFFDAGYYRNMFDNERVFRIQSIEDLINKVRGDHKLSKKSEQFENSSAKIIVDYLKEYYYGSKN